MPALPKTPGRFKLNWHQDREIYDTDHFMLINIGGYGSGKSQAIPIMMRERSKWDTEQRHGLFANTITQINEGILPDIYDWLDKLGIPFVFGSKPPVGWVRMWQKEGVPFPHRGPRSPHTLILRSGLHVVCGGLANQAYKRFKGFRFGSVWLEEVTEYSDPTPIYYLLPRVRCGDFLGGHCTAHHRHQMYLHGNPPDPRQPHWIRQWIRDKCAEEKERLKNGEPPFFLYLRSSTYDNVENVGYEYIRRLRQGLDRETAEAMVNGSLDQISSSTTFSSWSHENVAKLSYDPNRALHVAMDFNVMPAASTFGHELYESEVPLKFKDASLTYVGVFGEFANFQGMTAIQHARAILEGKKELGGHWPQNFKGLLEHKGHIFMYGDATAHMRRVESEDLRSAWEQVNNILQPALGNRYHFDVPRNNPSPYDTIAVFNAKLKNDDGEVTYFVAPWCTELIKDFESTVPKEDGSDWIDKRKDRMRTHWVDAERYKIWRRYPSNRRNNLRAFKNFVREGVSASPLATLGELPPVLGPRS